MIAGKQNIDTILEEESVISDSNRFSSLIPDD